MTDARYPERWLVDRRITRLSDQAYRLFVIALAWCVSNRTDGRIDRDDLRLIAGVDPGMADELVKAALWEETAVGWLIVDFGITQTPAHELRVLENARRRDREKKARQRARDLVPGDSPPGQSPGTAQDRQGQTRTGKDSTKGATHNESTSDNGWP
jgi:hypothetical protein